MRRLNYLEKQWLDKIFSVDFKGKEILQNQLNEVEVETDDYVSCIDIKFIIKETKNIYPFNIRDPVEMIAWQKDSAPVSFILHVLEGFLNKLEVFTADSSKLEISSISLENLEYIIYEE